jgi:hypothetical protein
MAVNFFVLKPRRSQRTIWKHIRGKRLVWKKFMNQSFMLDDNRLTYDKPVSPKFFKLWKFIAEEGSILFIQANKTNQTSYQQYYHISQNQSDSLAKSDGLVLLKKIRKRLPHQYYYD